MGGDAFRKVIAGSPLQISARAWSVLMEMAQWYLSARSSGAGLGGVNQSAGIVSVRNDTGGDLDRFSVVGVSEPIIGSTDHLQRFKNRVTLVGVTPADPDHLGRFAVLQEPLADGKIGRAVISGVTPVRLNLVDADFHKSADIEDGETAQLKSAQCGAATILWASGDEGSSSSSGSSSSGGEGGWAVVRLGNELTERGVWGEITDFTKDEIANRWIYSWKEIKKTGPGYDDWADVDGGLSGNENAYNSAEKVHNGPREPIPAGTPLWLREVITVDGEDNPIRVWWFDLGQSEHTSSSSSSSSW